MAPKYHFSVREISNKIFSFLDRGQPRKTLTPPTPGCPSPVKREKEIWTLKPVKDKYNLICFPSTLPTYWKVICTQKERKKVKIFCSIDSKLVNELCYMLQSGDLDIFSSKRKKKERKKKEKEEKDWWETFMFDTSSWLNIAGILKRKEKRNRNCFLNLIIICLVVAY